MNAILRDAEIAGAREADFLAQNPSFAPSAAKAFLAGLIAAEVKHDQLNPVLRRALNLQRTPLKHQNEQARAIREARIAIRFIRDLSRIADEIEEAVGKMEGDAA